MNRLEQKMSERILADEQVILTTDSKEFFNVVKKQKESDIWIRRNVGECKVVALDEVPIMAGQMRGQLNLVEASEDSDLADAMMNPGLALQTKDENGNDKLMPLRYTAMKSILDRGWISGGIFGRFSRYETAEVLNKCYPHFPETLGQILFRDGKISAYHSPDYQVLPTKDLCEALIHALGGKPQIDKYSFKVGEISHERVLMDIAIELKDRKPLENLLIEMGVTDVKLLKSAELLVRLRTSDIATASAKVLPAICIGDRAFLLGDELAMEHKGKEASISRFRELCEGVYSLLTTSIQKMSELGKIVMAHPEGALKGVAKKIGMPKREFYGVNTGPWAQYQQLHSPQPTAAELYRYLWAYPQAIEARDKKSNVALQEMCARALNLDWTEFDHEFEW